MKRKLWTSCKMFNYDYTIRIIFFLYHMRISYVSPSSRELSTQNILQTLTKSQFCSSNGTWNCQNDIEVIDGQIAVIARMTIFQCHNYAINNLRSEQLNFLLFFRYGNDEPSVILLHSILIRTDFIAWLNALSPGRYLLQLPWSL